MKYILLIFFFKDQLDHLDNNMTKKLDDKHSKKGGGAAVVHPAVSKDSTVIKSTNIKENRTSKIFLTIKI